MKSFTEYEEYKQQEVVRALKACNGDMKEADKILTESIIDDSLVGQFTFV